MPQVIFKLKKDLKASIKQPEDTVYGDMYYIWPVEKKFAFI
jgi:hypothetical protein